MNPIYNADTTWNAEAKLISGLFMNQGITEAMNYVLGKDLDIYQVNHLFTALMASEMANANMARRMNRI